MIFNPFISGIKGGYMASAKFNRHPLTIDHETVQIGSANELALALDVLQGEYDHATLTQLNPHLAKIVANASGFMLVMRSLSKEDQLFLIQSIGPDLPAVLQDATHLRDQLAVMALEDVEEALLKTLGGDGLRRLILTGEELAEILEWVYGQNDALVLNLLGIEAVRRRCRHAVDLSSILHNLNHNLQEKLLDELGWPFIVDLVRDGRDLAGLIRALPPESSQRLLRNYSGKQLVDLIGNERDWAYLCQRLEPQEADFIFGLLKHQSIGE
jgi:hypothetical protein